MRDQKLGITDEEIEAEIRGLDRSEKVELPEYTYDIHTRKVRMAGKIREQFFGEEQGAPFPKALGLFDEVIRKIFFEYSNCYLYNYSKAISSAEFNNLGGS
jgi:hypothetical protein